MGQIGLHENEIGQADLVNGKGQEQQDKCIVSGIDFEATPNEEPLHIDAPGALVFREQQSRNQESREREKQVNTHEAESVQGMKVVRAVPSEHQQDGYSAQHVERLVTRV